MISKFSYKQKMFFYFFTVFLTFTVIIILFQFSREKKYRVSQLENTLLNITQIPFFQNSNCKTRLCLKILFKVKEIVDKNWQDMELIYQSFRKIITPSRSGNNKFSTRLSFFTKLLNLTREEATLFFLVERF